MSREGQLLELLVPLERGHGPLHAQVERRLRDSIRAGQLVPGIALPSTRALARSLGVSRGVVFEAYGQLAAEGYLVARQGAATRVASRAATAAPRARPTRFPDMAGAHDLMPGRPDLSAFPRDLWLGSTRRVLRRAPDAVLGYPDPRGTVELREALSAYLGRARAVLPDPHNTVVTAGVTQGVVLLSQVLREQGHVRLAVEDPGFHLHRWSIARAGLEPAPVRVDSDGLDVEMLAATGARAVLVTPAHQMPTGVVLSPTRRVDLLAWADEVDGLVIEDDYDAEYRFDREPIGALQGVNPERVAYAGSASKTLANALRLGWLVLPERLARPVAWERVAVDGGGPVLEQLAFADLLARGEIDRHLRRTRRLYRRRRDALVSALAEHVPSAELVGAAAGLHALVLLPESVDEERLSGSLRSSGVACQELRELRTAPGPPGLVLGYAHLTEPALRRAVVALGEAVRQVV
ncbi:MAG: PLP-dependent aminotransferase family protein [Thermoleophilaceae bacterium]